MPTDHPIREILLATDFSPCAQNAMRVAQDLAAHFQARLHLLHVVPKEEERTTAMAALHRVSAELDEAVVMSVEVGAPSREIVKYAASKKADVIIMGTHGRKGLARAVYGSVTEAVIRSSPCQVLAVKLPEGVPLPAKAAEPVVNRRCLLCAQPSEDSICAPCKARIQAEAVERKRREMQLR